MTRERSTGNDALTRAGTPPPASDGPEARPPAGDGLQPGAPASAEQRGAEAEVRDSSAGRAIAGSEDDRRERLLIDAWRSGDQRAIATLLRGYQSRIYAVCYRMLRDQEEASDLTQEALVKVLEGLSSFDGRSLVSTWVIRVSMNCCLSYLRKRKLRRHVSLDDPGQKSGSWGSIGANLGGSAARPPGLGGAVPSGPRGGTVRGSLGTGGGGGGEPTAPDRVELRERREALLRALARLESETRAIIILRDTQGLDYQQIGEVLDVPVGTVKSRLFRARAALRELVESELARPDGAPRDRPAAGDGSGSPGE